MEITPTKLHERVSVFMGSKNEVERIAATTTSLTRPV